MHWISSRVLPSPSAQPAPCPGSSGESHAIVAQLAMIVVRISGSKTGCSTARIASRRGSAAGGRQKSDVEPYHRPLGPRTSAAGGDAYSALRSGGRSFAASFSSKSASCALRMTVPNESVLGIPGFGPPLDICTSLRARREGMVN